MPERVGNGQEVASLAEEVSPLVDQAARLVTAGVLGQLQEDELKLREADDAARLLLHAPAAEHRDAAGLLVARPELEVADADADDVGVQLFWSSGDSPSPRPPCCLRASRAAPCGSTEARVQAHLLLQKSHTHHVIQLGVGEAGAELVGVGLRDVVDDALLERLDVEDLHLDDIGGAPRVDTLHVDDRVFQLADPGALLGRQQHHGADAVGVVELEDVVEEAEQGRLVVVRAEDALEDEVGLGVTEDGRGPQHGREPTPTGGRGRADVQRWEGGNAESRSRSRCCVRAPQMRPQTAAGLWHAAGAARAAAQMFPQLKRYAGFDQSLPRT